MATTHVRGIDVYHEVAGDGQPVLLISGTGADLRNVPHDRHPLARHFETHAYDQRGLGQTSKPDEPYTMADYADDAAALIAALGLERAHVVGVSFGGMVAQHQALRHPAIVDRLVLMCTSPGGPMPSLDLLSMVDLSPEEHAAAYLLRMDTRVVPGEPLPEDVERLVALRAQRRPVTEPDAKMGAYRQLVARADHDVFDRLGDIVAPTLVIGGRTDGVAPPANLEAMADRIPDARLVFCNGGHMFALQDRTAWPTVIDFLKD
ncbi:MAG: alpha/beta hydrolase [Actinomycetota bacterium]